MSSVWGPQAAKVEKAPQTKECEAMLVDAIGTHNLNF